MPEKIVEFIRKKDYKLIKELGQGACGVTVLLLDEGISEHFVCKKYTPYSETRRQELFDNFVREVKILHGVHHHNVVRIFNHYLYPADCRGYLLMEYIEGSDIFDYLKSNPEKVNEVFLQVVNGFKYLESKNILHRDIRPGNMMVRDDGTVKIIDLGFGKAVKGSEDFNKSISLNWWCETPNEFKDSIYNFCTEVYFVGKLFEQMIHDFGISTFQYSLVLSGMCERNPKNRISSFSEVDKNIQSDPFLAIDFSKSETEIYRRFADALVDHIAKIDRNARYKDDPNRLQADLEDAYRGFMLEVVAPDTGVITGCFLFGIHYVRPGFEVEHVKDFIRLLKNLPSEKKRIVIAHIKSRLDVIDRYDEPKKEDDDGDIPF